MTRLANEIKQNCYQCYKNPQPLNVSSTLPGDLYWWNVHMEYFYVFQTHKIHAEKKLKFIKSFGSFFSDTMRERERNGIFYTFL